MIHIGIDISKISTALCIEKKNNNILLYNYTTKKPNNIWIKKTKELINYRFINYSYKNIKEYSDKEMKKFEEFENVSDLIINDILNNINLLDSIKITIEGFSYNSVVGPIIDLVEMSTLIKHKIKSKIKGMVYISILSPLTLKHFTCEEVYDPIFITKGKRIVKKVKVIQNKNGKLGKDFDKKDMFNALIDSKLEFSLKEHLMKNKDDYLKNKDLPKPMDDIIDSIFLKEYSKAWGN